MAAADPPAVSPAQRLCDLVDRQVAVPREAHGQVAGPFVGEEACALAAEEVPAVAPAAADLAVGLADEVAAPPDAFDVEAGQRALRAQTTLALQFLRELGGRCRGHPPPRAVEPSLGPVLRGLPAAAFAAARAPAAGTEELAQAMGVRQVAGRRQTGLPERLPELRVRTGGAGGAGSRCGPFVPKACRCPWACRCNAPPLDARVLRASHRRPSMASGR